MLYQRTGPTDFDELRIINSLKNKGTNSRVMGKSGGKGWFIGRGRTKGAIKLATADTYRWWCRYPPFSVYWFYIVRRSGSVIN